jgi:hypothetical protein
MLNSIPALEEWLGPISEPLGFVTLVVSDNRSSLKTFGRIGFEKQLQFPILQVRRRPWLLYLPPYEPGEFHIEKIARTPIG